MSKDSAFRHMRPYVNRDPKIGILQRSWIPKFDKSCPEATFVMKRKNYRVYAYIGSGAHHLKRILAVLDTGAGSSFIRKRILPGEIIQKIKPHLVRSNVRDASNRRVQISGTVNLIVKIGMRKQSVRFYVVENLGTDVIIG